MVVLVYYILNEVRNNLFDLLFQDLSFRLVTAIYVFFGLSLFWQSKKLPGVLIKNNKLRRALITNLPMPEENNLNISCLIAIKIAMITLYIFTKLEVCKLPFSIFLRQLWAQTHPTNHCRRTEEQIASPSSCARKTSPISFRFKTPPPTLIVDEIHGA